MTKGLTGPVIIYIQVDNYDEIMPQLPDSQRNRINAAIVRRIGEWAKSLDGIHLRTDRDKYMAFMDRSALEKAMAAQFPVLDHVRSIAVPSGIPLTLTLGVGAAPDYPRARYTAQAAMEIALGRGGDQAVVKEGDDLYYFGGHVQTLEKRSKVRSRYIAQALKRLMETYDRIYFLSHDVPDLDGLGSAVGLYACARSIEKPAHIVVDESNVSIERVMAALQQSGQYEGVFVNGSRARQEMTERDLLILLDVQRPMVVEVPELLQGPSPVVVIDHHRRSGDFVEGPILTYLESYASSTCELVAEISQYFGENVKLSALEAEAMLAGISMDTKGFVFNTGSRTFEAAGYLRSRGADTIAIRQLFQDDWQTYIARTNVVRSAEIQGSIAIACCPLETAHASLISAQAADQLLGIRGIEASFVLCMREKNVVSISARSLGNLNVQRIMEVLGGGGHRTVAGAQFRGAMMEDVLEKLRPVVQQFIKEEQK